MILFVQSVLGTHTRKFPNVDPSRAIYEVAEECWKEIEGLPAPDLLTFVREDGCVLPNDATVESAGLKDRDTVSLAFDSVPEPVEASDTLS